METKVLQFGEGNFLRCFIDWMVQRMNDKAGFNGAVQIIQPIGVVLSTPSRILNERGGKYHTCLRGLVNNRTIEEIEEITCVKGGDVSQNLEKYATDPSIRFVVSNTTEAGIQYVKGVDTFPAKIARLVTARYAAKLPGFVFIPCELIEHNGDKLKACTKKYIEDPAILKWLDEECVFCSTPSPATSTPRSNRQPVGILHLCDVGAYADDYGGRSRDRECHPPVRTNVTRKSFPFRLDRASADSFRRQLAEGVREAIRTGYYKSADVLPSLSQGVAELGVSDIVVRGAYRTLAAEGLVVPRKGVGSVVRPPKTPIWRGHVLCVMTDFDFNVSQCGIVGSLRDCLAANGYSFSQVLCLTARNGKQDLAGLETALCRPLDFAVLVTANDEIERRLSRSCIPFAVVGRRADDIFPGCIGGIEVSKVRGLHRLVVKCCTRGIRRVEIVCCKRISPEADCLMAELSSHGIDVTIGWVKDLWGFKRVEAAERTGYEFVRRNLRKRSPRWPDLYYVSDDYVARGMLQAFAAFGVRVPEDVRFVCSACAGFRPVFGEKRVAVLENAPYRHGAEIARRVLGWLTGHRPFTSAPIEHTFVEGDTFP